MINLIEKATTRLAKATYCQIDERVQKSEIASQSFTKTAKTLNPQSETVPTSALPDIGKIKKGGLFKADSFNMFGEQPCLVD